MFGKREIIAAVSAAVLFVGTVAFAASAPLSHRPSAADLPVIAVGRSTGTTSPPDEPATVTPEPGEQPTATPDAVDDDTPVGDHEVVAPPVRDDDPDSDDPEIEHDTDAEEPEISEPSDTHSDGGDTSETGPETEPDGE